MMFRNWALFRSSGRKPTQLGPIDRAVSVSRHQKQYKAGINQRNGAASHYVIVVHSRGSAVKFCNERSDVETGLSPTNMMTISHFDDGLLDLASLMCDTALCLRLRPAMDILEHG
jgi:hypothetical protein